jgi:hypothetical protein
VTKDGGGVDALKRCPKRVGLSLMTGIALAAGFSLMTGIALAAGLSLITGIALAAALLAGNRHALLVGCSQGGETSELSTPSAPVTPSCANERSRHSSTSLSTIQASSTSSPSAADEESAIANNFGQSLHTTITATASTPEQSPEVDALPCGLCL